MSSGKDAYDFDVAVIGGGSGGFAAARTAVGHGLKTVVVEGGKELGGLCILRGCMPTKALLHAAEVFHLTKHPGRWGIRTEEASLNWTQLKSWKDGVIKDFADYRARQLEGGKFEFVRAQAEFAGAHELRLSTGKTITARNIVIASGSHIAPSPLPDLADVGVMTSDTALELERLPRTLIVLGGGAVAVEFAQMFARFGVRVTMIQRSPHILHEFDSDAVSEVEQALRREGITLYTGTKLISARRTGDSKEVAFEHEGQTVRVRADEVFYGLGRSPNIESLQLGRAGVAVEYGRITTNTKMQTSAPHIYAAGDCTGLHEIVHIAIQQGETAAHNIANPGKSRTMDYRLLCEVVFSDPQVATVGLTEKQAHVRNIPYLTAKYPFNDHGKSIILGTQEGFVKLLADPSAGEIIGGCCVGPQGGELIHEIIAAMYKRMTVHELAVMPHYHPTLAEIWTYPAEELADKVPLVTPIAS